MPSFKEHCDQSERTFGLPYEEVHRWLDEFAGRHPYGMKHQHLRHHTQGIEEARRLFGNEGARAARQHIEAELAENGWAQGDPFPRSAEHFRALGLL